MLMSECDLGGDISNDCEGCVYSGDYHYDTKTGECVKRETRTKTEKV